MRKILFFISALFFTIVLAAQNTVGLIQQDSEPDNPGYVFFSPTVSTSTFMIDKCGRVVNEWESDYRTGHAIYFLPDGTLIRAGNVNNEPFSNGGGRGGIIERFDWEGNIIWSYEISDELKVQHHDFKVLPNGNILVIAWEMRTAEDAIAAGRDPLLLPPTLWSEQLLEIEPSGTNGGTIVWEWHLWDHLIQDFDAAKLNFGTVAENPGLIDINYAAEADNPDWIHLNSIDYNADLDQVVVSVHKFNELWIIDHSTNSEEAAGHTGGNSGMGGDILYRWGNPAAYDNGTVEDQKLYRQHNVHWIAEGLPFEHQIIIFNNGNGRPEEFYSTVEIIDTPVDGYTYNDALPYLPAAVSWIYNDGNVHDYYARNMSSAQQLQNGNLMLCHAPSGTFTEITANGDKVWEYINPVHLSGIWNQDETPNQNVTFRCSFYPSDYAGFEGLDLTPGDIIEDTNDASVACSEVLGKEGVAVNDLLIYPNPANEYIFIKNVASASSATTVLYSQSGQVVYKAENTGNEITVPVSGLAAGIYYIQVTSDAKQYNGKVVISR